MQQVEQQVVQPMVQQVVWATVWAMSGATDGAPGRWCEMAWATGGVGNRLHDRQRRQRVAHQWRTQQVVRPTAWAMGGPLTVHPTGSMTDSAGYGWRNRRYRQQMAQPTLLHYRHTVDSYSCRDHGYSP